MCLAFIANKNFNAIANLQLGKLLRLCNPTVKLRGQSLTVFQVASVKMYSLRMYEGRMFLYFSMDGCHRQVTSGLDTVVPFEVLIATRSV